MDPISSQATSTLITQFGLAGFVVVTSLGALIYVVKDLLKKSDRKDEQILKMAGDFSAALKNNTDAIHSLKESEIKLASATDQFQKWLTDAADKNEKEHKTLLDHQGHILDFVKVQARR